MAEYKKAPPPKQPPPKPIATSASTSSGTFYQTNGQKITGLSTRVILFDSAPKGLSRKTK